jgi:predicted RNA polymerase sigma factor
VQGMSYREIGRVLGLPETTIETRIARARRMLRERATAAGMSATGEDDRQATTTTTTASTAAALAGRGEEP